MAALKDAERKPQVVLDEVANLEGLNKHERDERASLPDEASTTDFEALKAQMEHRPSQIYEAGGNQFRRRPRKPCESS